MVYQTSQFDYLFLLNIPVPISTVDGEVFNLKTPNLSQYHEDVNYRRLESLFSIPLEEVRANAHVFGFLAEGYLEFLLGTKMNSAEDDKLMDLLEDITGLKVTKKSITCNGVPLREEDVLEIRFAYLVSIGRMGLDGKFIGSDQEEDELDKKIREAEEKIKALRGGIEEEKESIPLINMIKLITYELDKGMDEIRELNLFGLSQLYELAFMATYDKIDKIAAGNGLSGEKNPYKNILSK